MVGTHAYYLGNICEAKIQDGRHYIQNDIFWLIDMTGTCSLVSSCVFLGSINPFMGIRNVIKHH